jgi:hypothetical protein
MSDLSANCNVSVVLQLRYLLHQHNTKLRNGWPVFLRSKRYVWYSDPANLIFPFSASETWSARKRRPASTKTIYSISANHSSLSKAVHSSLFFASTDAHRFNIYLRPQQIATHWGYNEIDFFKEKKNTDPVISAKCIPRHIYWIMFFWPFYAQSASKFSKCDSITLF